MNNIVEQMLSDLKKISNPAKVKIYSGFFKTGPGQYGAGEIFWGVSAEGTKKVAKKYQDSLSLEELKKILSGRIHEGKVCALRVLVLQYEKLKKIKKEKKVVDFYLKNSALINNWDLVDLSAPKILGDYFFSREKKILFQLAKKKNLFQRRIAMVSTAEFIRRNDFVPTLRLAEILLSDKEDLIAKAVGWMLREVGKRDKKTLGNFLRKNKNKLPRVALRYAIEKFSPAEKKFWMKK